MLRIISDVHGKFDSYLKAARAAKHSLCLGDFGFSDSWNKLHYSGLNPESHKVLAGNHDPYDMAPQSPFYLGDFGEATIGGVSLFFIRGGISIDRTYREAERINRGPRTWWSQEELSFSQMIECMKAYRRAKPSIVVSHVPCASFASVMSPDDKILVDFGFHKGFKEATQLLGDELLKIHRPKVWTSGHFHKSFQDEINGTRFVGLAELEYVDIDSNGEIV
jgi:predicted phosphodiesterase